MTTHRVAVLGAGAAGSAAARVLAEYDSLDVTLIGRTGVEPYTRMLIKSVAVGSTPPEVTRLPLPDVRFLADTGVSVDTGVRRVLLRSHRAAEYDSLIVATGSTPRTLPASIPGFDEGRMSGAVTTLHSLRDALHVRRALDTRRKMRVLLYGGGVTASEGASLLADAGHSVSLIARSPIPGQTAFGRDLAPHVARLHGDRVSTRFGSAIVAISQEAGAMTAHLDDGTAITGDLLVVAMGTTPLSPAPWGGGIGVDDHQRTAVDHVWAAGGVALHDDTQGAWRIDHWEDSVAQGVHAARDLLHSYGLDSDPGPYLPRSPFLAMIHGHLLSGVGLTSSGTARLESGNELVVVHEHRDGVPVGVSGMDAVLTVHQWRERLHAAPPSARA